MWSRGARFTVARTLGTSLAAATIAGAMGASKGRVGLISLGCPKNLVDSEIMLGRLRERGFELVDDVEQASTVIVNTCGFIDEAKQESIDTILEVAARKGAGLDRLLVAGCMVNRYRAELQQEIPEIDGFVGLDDLLEVPELLDASGGPAITPSLVPLTSLGAPSQQASHRVFDHTAPRLLTTRGYAYLKVAEGCNNPCTFCAIPKWRGRFRSRTIESLVAEARALESQGLVELCLLAQDTTRYGEDLGYGRHGLLRLVEALLEATAVPWIRFLYAYPTTLDPELFELMGSEPRLASYLDMPLQHSHPDLLRAMRRGGRASTYLRLLERAREAVPDVFLRTTFIVGFPGEQKEHFEHLLEFVERARFDHLGAFVYSPEPGTPSAELAARPPRRAAIARRRELLARQESIALERRRRLVGSVLPMLIEGACEESEHLLQARHQGMAPEVDGRVLINDVLVEGGGLPPAGSFAEVEITEAYADDLVGRILALRGRRGEEVVQPGASERAGALREREDAVVRSL
ncbi:MAG TPA: 30S ribosomal protein S12 methylthiotransferase RimO [Thermoanaerobaculia bacterium]|nr:30S ribosomal protein S12 methylthiotransferase RimO [Thermoanaerobaculia bacterium]